MFPKFTLTYGVRYEAFTPPTEINGHIANLAVNSDFTQVQCVTPVATGDCIAGPTPSLFHGHYNNWAPRLGIAWQPPGKMVFRAAPADVSRRVQHVLRRVLLEYAVERNGQPAALRDGKHADAADGAQPCPLSFQTNLSVGVAEHGDQYRGGESELSGSLRDDLECRRSNTTCCEARFWK